MINEDNRRSRRSEDPLVAMHYLLESCAGRASITAMVVADERGELLADSTREGITLDLERLASLLPFLSAREEHASVIVPAEGMEPHRLLVRRFCIGGEHTVYLGVLGVPAGPTYAEALTAARGLERILS